jgi:DNA-binding LytR/AlgR family response regulator
VPLHDIDWIESARESLREIEQRACAHGFVRAHRNALVPIADVREVTRTT